MWILDPSWRNLALGYETAATLEAAARKRWSKRIQAAEHAAQARVTERYAARKAALERDWQRDVTACEERNAAARARFEQQRAAWQTRVEATRRRFAEDLAAWQVREAERRGEFDRILQAWSAEHAVARSRLWERARVVVPVWLVPTLVATLLFAASAAFVVFVTVAALCAGAALFAPARDLVAHRTQRPKYTTDDLRPVEQLEPEPACPDDEAPPPRPDSPPAPGVDRGGGASLQIIRSWWKEVSAARHPSNQGAAHGDQGVAAFIAELDDTLSDDYLVTRDLLVRKGLDVDVLVVGPSGVWAFEVKHWSGRIVCRDGDWYRERTYFASGGIETTERKNIGDAFDEQWQREVDAIAATLTRRLKGPIAAAAKVRGGLVFSHDAADLDIDDSCDADYGTPGYWAGVVGRAPSLRGFDEAQRLRVLDALFTWSRKLEGDEHAACAKQLAVDVNAKAGAAAARHVQRLDATN